MKVMIELINGVHHKPHVTYYVDRHHRVVRHELYPHRRADIVITGPMWTFRAWQLAFRLSTVQGAAGSER